MIKPILFDVQNGCGVITLNRPQALNAINLDMIQAMRTKLATWARDDQVYLVVIKGTGDKAFCAGGDLKEIYAAAIKGDQEFCRTFFKEEYDLNQDIATFPKPYVSLCKGYTMGGGMGLAMHTPYRIATTDSLFAMPENAIGFFPDVGASYFLQSCPGSIGLFFALTGTRFNAAEALFAGLATHYIAQDGLDIFFETLVRAPKKNFAAEVVQEALSFFATEPDFPTPVLDNKERIDACFSGETLADCLAVLRLERGAYLTKALHKLEDLSPLSLAITYTFFQKKYKVSSLKAALARDYVLSQKLLQQGNFIEGIRALLVDKDRFPQWVPALLEDVDVTCVDAMFA